MDHLLFCLGSSLVLLSVISVPIVFLVITQLLEKLEDREKP